MSVDWGPAVLGRKLCLELRTLRRSANATQSDVAKVMDWSVSKVTRVENGEVRIATNDLKMLLSFYGVEEKAQVDEYLAMAKASRHSGHRAKFSGVHSETFLKYLEFEAAARRIRKFNSLHIPGLLQIEEYCMAVQRSGCAFSPADAALRWEARSLRQQLHHEDDPPEMWVILDEAAIRREVGGPEVMIRQAEHLVTLSSAPHLTLQVVPFEAGAYEGMKGPFIVLEFDDPALGDMLYLEPPFGEMHLIDDLDVVGPYGKRFDRLAGKALTPAETKELLEKVVVDLKSKS